MGRLLGSFADENELDRPDLNKCPDCGCFFPQDNCPLCGKPCPEEMRAGNRRPVKKKKARRTDDRVVFVEWYHSWWFIILMLILFPIAGLVLLITSPHKRGVKLGIAAVAVVYTIVTSIGIGNIISNIISNVAALFDRPVDTSLSQSEYIAACADISAEDYYRAAAQHEDDYLRLTMVVERQIHAGDETYYLCRSTSGQATVLVRDCFLSGGLNLLPGDSFTVWGEGAGVITVYDPDYNAYTAPCLNGAYLSLVD